MGQGKSIPEYKIDAITGEGSKDVFKYNQYNIFKDFRLGGGAFGNVYKGYDTKKHRHIAAKEILHASAEFSQSEVDVLRKLTDHDNIVKLYDTFVYNETRYIIMQLCDGLCLDKFLIEKNPAIDVSFEIISQLIETLQYIHFHTSPTAHRDIKPGNIIIVHGSHVKLCDFGLAKFMDITKTMKASTIGGSLAYMSPELHTGRRHDPFKADAFAAGLVFLAIITYVVGESIGHVFQEGKWFLLRIYVNYAPVNDYNKT
jgi:serine/threonine protein kinase